MDGPLAGRKDEEGERATELVAAGMMSAVEKRGRERENIGIGEWERRKCIKRRADPTSIVNEAGKITSISSDARESDCELMAMGLGGIETDCRVSPRGED